MSNEKLHNVIKDMVANLVDNEKAVLVEMSEAKQFLLFQVTVASSDYGKLIGQGGQHATALRLLVRSMGRKHQKTAFIELVDPRGGRYQPAENETLRDAQKKP